MKISKIIIILILLIAIGSFFFLRTRTTGEAVKDYYTYTKAICDENNFCQDYEIKCENREVVSMEPITGATIKHSNTWEDPRKQTENLCE